MARFRVRFDVSAESRDAVWDAMIEAWPEGGIIVHEITPIQEQEEDTDETAKR